MRKEKDTIKNTTKIFWVKKRQPNLIEIHFLNNFVWYGLVVELFIIDYKQFSSYCIEVDAYRLNRSKLTLNTILIISLRETQSKFSQADCF